MKKKRLFSILGVSGLILLMIALSFMVACVQPTPTPTPTPSPTPQQTFWRIQSAFPATDLVSLTFAPGVAKLLEDASGGQIKTQIFSVGGLVAPDQMITAAQKGAIEVGLDIPSTLAGLEPAILVGQLPGATSDVPSFNEFLVDRGVLAKLRSAFAKYNLYLLSYVSDGTITFQSTFPVNTLDDLKGKKCWIHSPNVDTFKELGVIPSEIPGWDLYTALKLGTLDGASYTNGELELSKHKEVVKYLMLPPMSIASCLAYVGMDTWNALGAELQKKIQDAADKAVIPLSEDCWNFEKEALAKAQEYGVKFIQLPDADVARLRELQQKNWAVMAAKSPLAAELVQIARDYVKSKGP